MMSPQIIDTNPGGLAPSPYTAGLIDNRPHRNKHQPALKKGKALPDDLLISVWCSIGCPRWFAEQLRESEQLRFQAASVYFLVEKAARGEHVQHPVTGYLIPAKDLVDLMRFEYQELRKVELVADDPMMSVGLFER